MMMMMMMFDGARGQHCPKILTCVIGASKLGRPSPLSCFFPWFFFLMKYIFN